MCTHALQNILNNIFSPHVCTGTYTQALILQGTKKFCINVSIALNYSIPENNYGVPNHVPATKARLKRCVKQLSHDRCCVDHIRDEFIAHRQISGIGCYARSGCF